MPRLGRVFLAFLLALCWLAPARAQTIVPLPIGMPSINSPGAVAADSSGDLFVIDGKVIKKIKADSHAISVVASGTTFGAPSGIAIDGGGNLFVTDAGNNAIDEIAAASGYADVTTILAFGLDSPAGLALDGAGNIFFADTGNKAVKEILAAGGYRTVNTLTQAGDFIRPVDIAVDGSGNVFVTDLGQQPYLDASTVKEILLASGYGKVTTLTTIPISGTSFAAAAGIALDRAGNLFIAIDTVTINPRGSSSNSAGISELLAIDNYASGTGLTPGFGVIGGLTLDGSGNLFVIDALTPAISEIPAEGGYASVQIVAKPMFRGPFGIGVDSTGNVFVASGGNQAISEIPAAGGYTTVTALLDTENGTAGPTAMAVDGAGDVFYVMNQQDPSNSSSIYELSAASGHASAPALASESSAGFRIPAVDAAGNLFTYTAQSGSAVIEEFLASGGYTTVNTISVGTTINPLGMAVDRDGNLFLTDSDTVTEIPAAGGYATNRLLPIASGGLFSVTGIATDSAGNLFVADQGDGLVKEITAASGYTVVKPLSRPGDFIEPAGIAVDAAGNVFVTDTRTYLVKEILAGASPLAAAILPGGRTLAPEHTATVFATMINGGAGPFDDCYPSLPASAPPGLSLSYQTSDAATNALTGQPGQPVILPAGASQSFVLSFYSADQILALDQSITFACDGTVTAPIVPGVDTVDLDFGFGTLIDVIALAATATNDGTVHVANGTGAFAVATFNDGVAGSVTATLDTGAATLPLTATLCQTDATGQCLAPPSSSLTMSLAADATPTFSVFVGTSAPIAFAPATARVFLRFTDSTGLSHGSTSVAVTTDP